MVQVVVCEISSWGKPAFWDEDLWRRVKPKWELGSDGWKEGQLTRNDRTCARWNEADKWLETGWQNELDCWFQKQHGDIWRTKWLVLCNKEDICDQARRTTDDARVLRGWTMIRLCRYTGSVIVRKTKLRYIWMPSTDSVTYYRCRRQTKKLISKQKHINIRNIS